jgi:hypothetical protein
LRIAILAGALLLFSLKCGEPWTTLAIAVFLFSLISSFFDLRNALHEFCKRRQKAVSKDAIAAHMGAAAATLISYVMFFNDPDPRVASAKWTALVLLPVCVYLLFYFFALFERLLDWPGGALSGPAPKQGARKRKRSKPPSA